MNCWANDSKPDLWNQHLDRLQNDEHRGEWLNTTVDAAGHTILHLTILRNTVRWVEDLLDLGANPYATNHEGVTPLGLIRAWGAKARPCREAMQDGMHRWDVAHERQALTAVLNDTPVEGATLASDASDARNTSPRRRL